MKFLGEFIQHFVSRFRNDIFLEDVSSGTIASGGYLGVDSNNKIVKASTVGSSVDLTSEATGVLPVSNGGTGASTLTSNSLLTGNGTSAIQAETHLTWDASSYLLSIEGEGSSNPVIKIQNNHSDATPGELKFRKLASASDGDDLGKISFVGFAPSGSPTDVEFATILGEVNEADDGDEEGKLTLSVASHDGESQPGVTIVSGNAEDEVDVTIANGATSLTTIAGSLTVTSDLTVSGTTTTIDTTNLNVEDKNITLNYNASSDTSSSADGAGITIQDAVDASNDATILWTAASDTFTFSHPVNATIATATQGTIDHDSLANFVAAEHYRWDTDISSTATIHTNNITDLHGAGVSGSANQLLTDDGDGTVTSQSNVTYSSSSNLFNIQSGTSQKPVLSITNANEDAEAPELQFRKAAGLAADGDQLGKIEFRASDTDNTGNDAIFAQIVGEVQEADNNSEEGKLTLNVASHDQELQPGLIIASGNAEDEVDVTVGNGATSSTTIAGTLTMGSTAFVNNSGVIQVATQGTIDHDSLANFVANEHIDWTGSSAGTIHSTNIPTLNQDTTGNAATATALTSGDKTIEGNLRIGGSGDTSNNWISIDAQNGDDSSGGGITFYETGTYSVNAPQYGAKIVYNEDDDEFAIGTMHNNTFQRQIHMDRGSTTVNMQNIHLERSTTDGPFFLMTKTDTSIADGDSLCRIIARSADFSTSTNISQIQWFATEDHDSNSCGVKMNFTVTPNGNSQSETTAMTIDQDSSVTINGDLTVTSGTSGDATLIIEADTDNNEENDLPRLWFKADGGITEGAIQLQNNTFDIINNISGSGGIRFLTGTTNNTGTTDPSTGATERMSIASGGTVTVAGALQPDTIELGHASDTTITRGSAGVVKIEGNTIVTTAGSQTPMGSGTEDMPNVVFQLRKTLTTADMNSLHTTPVTLHNGAGTNKVIMPIGGFIRVDRAATNTNSPGLNIHYSGLTASYGTTSIVHYRRFMNGVTTDAVFGIVPVAAVSNRHLSDITSDINNKVVISSDGAFTTNCFTSVDIFMTYQIIQIV